MSEQLTELPEIELLEEVLELEKEPLWQSQRFRIIIFTGLVEIAMPFLMPYLPDNIDPAQVQQSAILFLVAMLGYVMSRTFRNTAV